MLETIIGKGAVNLSISWCLLLVLGQLVRKEKTRQTWFLVGIFSVLLLVQAHAWIVIHEIIGDFPYIYRLSVPLLYLLGPMSLAIYYSNGGILPGKRMPLHFLPSLAALLIHQWHVFKKSSFWMDHTFYDDAFLGLAGIHISMYILFIGWKTWQVLAGHRQESDVKIELRPFISLLVLSGLLFLASTAAGILRFLDS